MRKVLKRNSASIPLYFLLFICFFFSGSMLAQDIDKGKSLFNSQCAACHKLKKKAVGPALAGVTAKYDREWLYSWIKNSAAMIKAGDPQAVAIWEEYNKTAMNAFPQLSNEDIDNILAYTDYTPPAPEMPAQAASTGGSTDSGFTSDIILAMLALVLAVLIVMLFLVNKTLRKFAVANGLEEAQAQKKKDFHCGKPTFRTNSWYF